MTTDNILSKLSLDELHALAAGANATKLWYEAEIKRRFSDEFGGSTPFVFKKTPEFNIDHAVVTHIDPVEATAVHEALCDSYFKKVQEESVSLGYAIERIPIEGQEMRGLKEPKPITEFTLDELYESLKYHTKDKANFVQFITDHPAIDWHESRFGPVPIKMEGRRVTEDPLEDELRLAAHDERINAVTAEINRRLIGEPADPNTPIVEGDGVELLSVRHPQTAADLTEETLAQALADLRLQREKAQTHAATEGDPLPQIKDAADQLFDSGLITEIEHADLTRGAALLQHPRTAPAPADKVASIFAEQLPEEPVRVVFPVKSGLKIGSE